ncbi:MAG: acyl carrier protein [Steroidobacteraceae bacterium]
MNDADLEQKVLDCFLDVAPDVDAKSLQRNVLFRAQFDFDSMDTLNFALNLHKAFGIEIPEKDYGRLAGLDDAIAYVRHRKTAPSG